MLSVEILEGNLRRLKATFRVPGVGANLDDPSTWTLTDPTTVTFRRKRLGVADSTIESWTYAANEITRDSLGVYEKVLDFETDGSWRVSAEGTGACQAYDEAAVIVKNAEARP